MPYRHTGTLLSKKALLPSNSNALGDGKNQGWKYETSADWLGILNVIGQRSSSWENDEGIEDAPVNYTSRLEQHSLNTEKIEKKKKVWSPKITAITQTQTLTALKSVFYINE